MATARLLVEYDGTEFAGWARQPGLRTVQGELERVLSVVARREVTLTVGGRTDRGVHASGQVCAYPGDPVRLRSLNGLLPPDIAVVSCEEAPDGFDARRDAVARSYRYRIVTRRSRPVFARAHALHHPRPLDLALLRECAALAVGRHDFTAFTPTETEHVHFHRRILDAAWEKTADGVDLTITADAFMRHMNRVLVGTMLEVSAGRRDVESFAALLRGAHRRDAGPTAPPHGLTLERVDYPAR